ncbi:WD repeat-containing protein 44-like [Carya illinoinensis]|uniref:WD repeat-containing protein 44 n=2 Tax=Carya illinoinensis TaxID=32201 RepID=A0A8T1QR92_CARIL|nr:WD repeat-containing protein 44-like [Carya illinoinensis]XP_042974925.1 WD repeat-containing protein 44-like [Carya illinoinensis]XP_042974926.1 WD repeat-containing protein 44-like [Carya illinoinensis]XP_042974927.1 WD repeat-containing protein 44-like [Carya illinoinensis]XP_042974928.1 WD repeat-containing protein 44-like [Carya illinoinensis]KAG6657366.1 hypothetical protein CIPAW_04G086100 [Carya illinoinensis]KAG6657367.1 hypothetical protein CIPAW_04G086100 [Carya illinoinensis]K
MLRSDEGEIDVFFDSTDCCSSVDSVADEALGSIHLEYGVWMNAPVSVKERREVFLRGMGLSELASPKICAEENGMDAAASQELMGLERLKQCSGAERLKQCSGAFSSSCISSTDLAEENLVCCRRERGSVLNGEDAGLSSPAREYVESDVRACSEEYSRLDVGKRRLKNWLKHFVGKSKGGGDTFVTKVSKPNSETPKINRMKVWQNKKRYMEFTALYNGQEIPAHNGLIWTMKFSPDGRYLASGGEDGVVRIWCVTSEDASDNYMTAINSYGIKVKGGKSTFGGKSTSYASIDIPDKVFHIEESPLQEFHGHSSDVLDLSWSHSNCLLSSSTDKTVRLWRLGCKQCLNVFRHNDYVTCIQFNPVDENYFISGSIDGKIRLWRVSEKHVVDWADVRDVITAICYKPDGKVFIVGSIRGTCRFYDASGKHLKLDAQIRIQGRKKTSANKITGIQFCQERSQRVMITSEDSKLRVYDGIDLVQKYRGLPKSGSQMSASFTSSGTHIVSNGEDSRVYLWNYDGMCIQTSKRTKSVRSCEHFFSEGVTVAIPWSGSGAGQRSSQALDQEATSRFKDSERLSSRGNWFSMDGSCRGYATWPEEKLPLWDVPVSEEESQDQHHGNAHKHRAISNLWGLVIVTAGCDGTIRTFHNYGLPVRL